MPSCETINSDLDPPAIYTGLREETTSEYTGYLTFEPFSPPSWSLSFNPQTSTTELLEEFVLLVVPSDRVT